MLRTVWAKGYRARRGADWTLAVGQWNWQRTQSPYAREFSEDGRSRASALPTLGGCPVGPGRGTANA